MTGRRGFDAGLSQAPEAYPEAPPAPPAPAPPPTAPPQGQPSRSLLLPYLALASLALIWGASFLFIKIAVADLSPTVLVLVRAASASATLGLILLLIRRNPTRSLRRRLASFTVMAILSSVVPWIAISWGEVYISSGLASILNATTPLWTAVFAWWVTPLERPSPLNYIGVAAGFAGTAIVVAPDLLQHGLRSDTLATLVALAGAVSYAAAAVFQRRRLAGVHALDSSLWQMAIATLLTLPLALPTLPSTRLDPRTAAAALALGVVGSGIAYILYYYLLNTLGATRASTVTFLLPVTAVFWGATLLHEVVTIPILVGMAVILVGIFLTSRRRSRGSSQGPTRGPRQSRHARPGPSHEPRQPG